MIVVNFILVNRVLGAAEKNDMILSGIADGIDAHDRNGAWNEIKSWSK